MRLRADCNEPPPLVWTSKPGIGHVAGNAALALLPANASRWGHPAAGGLNHAPAAMAGGKTVAGITANSTSTRRDRSGAFSFTVPNMDGTAVADTIDAGDPAPAWTAQHRQPRAFPRGGS